MTILGCIWATFTQLKGAVAGEVKLRAAGLRVCEYASLRCEYASLRVR